MPPEPHDGVPAPAPPFRQLFEHNFAYVIRSLRRLGVHEREVEDLAQDVFLAVHQRFANYDPARPIRPWLFAFVARITANHLRLARHRTMRLDKGNLETVDRSDGPETQVAARQDRELLLRALQQVPFDRRRVLVMHELDGCTAPVIAEALDLPVNTVYSRIRVGREELVRAVRDLRGVES